MKHSKKQDILTTSKAQFLITIYKQEHHSLQGAIHWVDTGKVLHFRSELEMLQLIQEASAMQHNSIELRSWTQEAMQQSN